MAEEAAREPLELHATDWRILPGLLGLPVEADAPALSCVPWATAGLAVAIVLAFLASLHAGLQETIRNWGFVPDAMFRHLGATFVTSFFLHGGWFHLGSNLWFLLVFGDNTEDALGRWRYLAMIAAGHLAGTVAELLVPGSGAIPRVGASAGISAVVAFYALKFPHARLGMLFRYFYSLRWVTFSARTGFFLWVALQVVGAVFEFQGLGGVAHLAHLGGAAAGLAWWWRDEKRHSAGTFDPDAST
ncbi:MAG: rhomboid family intramembrane serine protease [Verrucomicrobia bacterium]|nr:MAG: rhomboid family intramembrane serine protease [Verrucomicrobiota bacterium]